MHKKGYHGKDNPRVDAYIFILSHSMISGKPNIPLLWGFERKQYQEQDYLHQRSKNPCDIRMSEDGNNSCLEIHQVVGNLAQHFTSAWVIPQLNWRRCLVQSALELHRSIWEDRNSSIHRNTLAEKQAMEHANICDQVW